MAGGGNFGVDVSFPVGATALTAYSLVKTPAALVVSAAATDDCIGVVQDGADANASAVTVRVAGRSKVIASAAIAKGAYLGVASGGKVVTHDGTTGNPFIGIALSAATADGDIIDAHIGSALGAGPAA